MTLNYLLVDVFTERIFGGNPLAVFLDGDGLDASLMQSLAAELNLSETAFVLTPQNPAHTIRLRIFTPAIELPFAGHPTLGTALALALRGDLMDGDGVADWVFEEMEGPVAVRAEMLDGRFSAELVTSRAPARGPAPPPASALGAMLGLDEGDVDVRRFEPAVYSCGVPFTLIPLTSETALQRIAFDTSCWQSTLAGFEAPHVYAVVLPGSGSGDGEVRARMFAPAMGIAEDPATGAAASALAGYLRDFGVPGLDGSLRWRVRQGVEMGRPSLIELRLDRGSGLVGVRGSSVRVGQGQIMLPEQPAPGSRSSEPTRPPARS